MAMSHTESGRERLAREEARVNKHIDKATEREVQTNPELAERERQQQ